MRNINFTSQPWRKSVRLPSLAVAGSVCFATIAVLGAGSAHASTVVTVDLDSFSTGTPVAEIPAGRVLASGQSVSSPQGRFTLTMKPSGELVIAGAADRVIWSSGTGDNPGANASMTADGDLKVVGVDGTVLWSTKTSLHGAHAVINDSGDLVVTSTNNTAWTSGTSARAAQLAAGESLAPGQQLVAGGYSLTEQVDGNVVITGPDAATSWSLGTDDAPGATLTLQPNGALKLSGANDTVTWTTGAHEGAQQLTLTETGNLAMLDEQGTVLWDLESATAAGNLAAPVRTGISRAKIIERAHFWLETQPQYSQASTSADPKGRQYRSDCSGYVSMAWSYEGQGIGATTTTLPSIATKIDWDAVQPGDALLRDGHVVLVASWDGNGGEIWHMSSPSTDMVDEHRTLASLKAQGYTPYSYNNAR